jgi:hypothetical protein
MIKNILLVLLIMSFGAGKSCLGSDWGPITQTPIVQRVEYVPYYYTYTVPVITMVPVITQYVPVVKYENFMVKTQSWCLLKKYQMVMVPKVVYIPINQINRY